MNSSKWVPLPLGVGLAAIAFCLIVGCTYEIPITSSPTRKIEEKLLGDWVSQDGKEKMKVRKLDDSIYIVSYNGDLFRAYHSDVGRTAFVSVQDIDSAARKFCYMSWKLSDNGQELGLRVVSDKIVPVETKDSPTVQRLLEENLQNPDLLREEERFRKVK